MGAAGSWPFLYDRTSRRLSPPAGVTGAEGDDAAAQHRGGIIFILALIAAAAGKCRARLIERRVNDLGQPRWIAGLYQCWLRRGDACGHDDDCQ